MESKNTWDLVAPPALRRYVQTLPIEAVLMAGGLGSRLGELTQNLPKPLLRVGKSCLLDYMLKLLSAHQIPDVHIAIRHLGHKIVKHILEHPPQDFTHLRFIRENKPLGTLGAISLLKSIRQPYLLVMNGDLLTDIDLTQMFQQMVDENADLLVATASHQVDLPYGIVTTLDGHIQSCLEKPSYTFEVNAGIYLFHKRILPLIPENEFFDAPELIELLISQGKTVQSFPIKGFWQDISKPEDYTQACQYMEQVRHFP